MNRLSSVLKSDDFRYVIQILMPDNKDKQRLVRVLQEDEEILEGMHDSFPEQALYMVGTIEDAIEKAKTLGV